MAVSILGGNEAPCDSPFASGTFFTAIACVRPDSTSFRCRLGSLQIQFWRWGWLNGNFGGVMFASQVITELVCKDRCSFRQLSPPHRYRLRNDRSTLKSSGCQQTDHLPPGRQFESCFIDSKFAKDRLRRRHNWPSCTIHLVGLPWPIHRLEGNFNIYKCHCLFFVKFSVLYDWALNILVYPKYLFILI